MRKAQENNSRNQYQEPVILPSLRTDTIYVQGKNGFSAVKIPAERITRGHRDPDSGETIMYPIKVAILAQKAWKNAGLIYQGLLAGMAFMHFLAVSIIICHKGITFTSHFILIPKFFSNYITVFYFIFKYFRFKHISSSSTNPLVIIHLFLNYIQIYFHFSLLCVLFQLLTSKLINLFLI